MSLINKMLRDLDARNAPSVDRAALPHAVHGVPDKRKRPWLWLVLALVAVAAAAWYLAARPGTLPWGEKPAPKVIVATMPIAPAPPPALAAPATISAPAAAPPEPVAAPPAAAPAPPAIPPAAAAAPAAPAVAARAAPAAGAPAAPAVQPAPPSAAAASKPPGPPIRSAAAASGKPKESAAGAPKPKSRAEGIDEDPKTASEPRAQEPKAAGEAAGIEKRPRSPLGNEAAEQEYAKALTALRRGSAAAAINGLHAALRLDSGHTSARQALISQLLEHKQLAEARAVLEEGLVVNPAQSGWAMALARLQFEAGRAAEAMETLVRHAAYAERDADYQAFHALLLQKQKRLADAADRYRAALALKPDEGRWWYGLGLVLEADRKPQEARDAYLRAKHAGTLSPDVAAAVEARLR